MLLRLIAIAAASLMVTTAPAAADAGDEPKKQWEHRADCDRKLSEAKSSRDLYQKAGECTRELAKLRREQRREAAKAWREAGKKWRQRHRDYDDGYYDWDG